MKEKLLKIKLVLIVVFLGLVGLISVARANTDSFLKEIANRTGFYVASKLIEKERRDLEQQITKQQQEITQLENNLGFVSRSKAGDALRKDVEHKISIAKNRIKDMKNKIKLLNINE